MQKHLVWQGKEVDFEQNTYAITEKRITSMKKLINNIYEPHVATARKLSKLVSLIVSEIE